MYKLYRSWHSENFEILLHLTKILITLLIELHIYEQYLEIGITKHSSRRKERLPRNIYDHENLEIHVHVYGITTMKYCTCKSSRTQAQTLFYIL